MNIWKKAMALVMALGMTFAFAACDGGETSESGASNGGSNAESSVATGEPEELSKEALNALIQELYTVDNLTITVTGEDVDEDGAAYTSAGTISYADGKCYQEITKNYASGAKVTVRSYTGKVDGTYYLWTSENGSEWECTAFEGLEAGENPTSNKYYLEEFLQWSTDPYFEYDKATGMHVFTPWDQPILQVKVVGGKIVEYGIEASESVWEKGELSYGNASVGELPSVTA